MNLEFVEQIVRLIGDYPCFRDQRGAGRATRVRPQTVDGNIVHACLCLMTVVMSTAEDDHSQVADAPTEAVSLRQKPLPKKRGR